MPSNERLQHAGGAAPTTLNGSISSGATSATLQSSTGWPDGSIGPFYAVIDQGTASEEKVLITSRTSTTLNSITRGADGTSAAAHSSGATIAHCYSADEADASNALVVATFGTVTTKGDLTPATGSGALGRLAAGANNTVLHADSTSSRGLSYSQIVAADIANGTITNTQLTSSLHWVTGQWNGTTDSNGTLTVTHGAGFTPTYIFTQVTGIGQASTNRFVPSVFTIGATTFQIDFMAIAGTVATVATTGFFVCFP